MNKINLSKDNSNTSNNIFNTNNMSMMGMRRPGMPTMGGMGMGHMGPMGQMQRPTQPKNKHIILKIALLIWAICTVRAVLSVISEGIEMKNSIEVTALVVDCLAKEVYDDDDDYSSIEYVTYVRYTTDRTYEGRTTLSQRYKEGDYITINVSSKDNSKIVGNTGSVAGNVFMVLFISSIFLLFIIIIRNVASE